MDPTNTPETTETVAPTNVDRRRTPRNVKLPLKTVLYLNKQQDLSPITVIGDCTIIDQTKEVPLTMDELLAKIAELRAANPNATAEDVPNTKPVGTTYTVSDLFTDRKIRPDLDTLGIDMSQLVDINVPNFVKKATHAFSQNLFNFLHANAQKETTTTQQTA